MYMSYPVHLESIPVYWRTALCRADQHDLNEDSPDDRLRMMTLVIFPMVKLNFD